MTEDIKNYLKICLTLVIFLLLDLLSFSTTLDQIMPAFFLLGFIYWNIALPEKINLYFSVLFGFILDFINGNPLGLYPMILITLSYLAQRFFYQFRPLRFVQQAFIIFIIFLILKFVLAIDYKNINTEVLSLADKTYLYNSIIFSLVNSFTWILIYQVLREYRRRWIKT
tara:strand:+ start:17003 stop:17509 length:507 start_codon:yes stop_codon:yes gene_type:complete